MSRTAAGVLAVPFLLSCAAGDTSAVRSFHSSMKPGMSILDAVLEGNRAQRDDASFLVTAHDCPGPYVELERSFDIILRIRVTEPLPVSNPSSSPGYVDVGYSDHDEFADAVSEKLPAFYSCKTFRFVFFRKQFWPTSDAFSVTIDSAGAITSVSDLTEE